MSICIYNFYKNSSSIKYFCFFQYFFFTFFSHKPFHLAQDLYIFYLFLPLYHTNIYNYLLAVQCFLSRFSFWDKTPNQRCSAFCLVFHFGTKLPISGAVLFVSFFFSGQNSQSAVQCFLSRFSFQDKIPFRQRDTFCLVFFSGQNPANKSPLKLLLFPIITLSLLGR